MRTGKARATARFESDAERKARLRREAEAAAASFRRTGRVLSYYDRAEVLGTMIALGLATLAELKAAGASVTERMTRRIGERP